MKTMILGMALAMAAHAVFAQAPDSTMSPDNSKTNQAPDNSKVKSSTADGQSNAQSDIDITRQIRKSVIADKSLSLYAHNVKIVTVGGAVTLNGTVRSEDEKQRVAAKAQAVAGAEHVTNDLKVAPPKS